LCLLDQLVGLRAVYQLQVFDGHRPALPARSCTRYTRRSVWKT
jgi:hypothetical protein